MFGEENGTFNSVFWKYCPGKTVEAMLERSTPGGREAPQEAPAVAIQTGEECVS